VIKLHGSVGWYRCVDPEGMYVKNSKPPRPEYDELLIMDTVRDALGYSGLASHSPEKHRAVRSDSVVLPAYLKSIDGYPLPTLWKKASDRLREAERVVVVGYSFPRADTVAQTLFLSSIPADGRVDFYWVGSDQDPKKADRTKVYQLRHFFGEVGIAVEDRLAKIEELAEMGALPLG
jgi:hypothetical protein